MYLFLLSSAISSLLFKKLHPLSLTWFLFSFFFREKIHTPVSPRSKFVWLDVYTSTFESTHVLKNLTFPLEDFWCRSADVVKVKWINLQKIERKICRDFHRQLYGGIFQGRIWKCFFVFCAFEKIFVFEKIWNWADVNNILLCLKTRAG